MQSINEINSLLQAFQEGYTRRDVTRLQTFMDLFSETVEVIGTNGVKPGVDEWYTHREGASELVKGDWESWGDLRLDLENATIRSLGDVGWIATSATVTQRIGSENYASYLDFVKDFIETSILPAEQKLHYILRGGTNTVFELRRGEIFTWPLRFTAVVAREHGVWKFVQVNFSFPTIYFPDVRLIDPVDLN